MKPLQTSHDSLASRVFFVPRKEKRNIHTTPIGFIHEALDCRWIGTPSQI